MYQITLTPTNDNKKQRIKLSFGRTKKIIGVITNYKESIFITKRHTKHIYRKLNAFGVNEELLLRKDIDFDWVIILFDYTLLFTKRKYFIENSELQLFQNSDLDRQLFLRLDNFNKIDLTKHKNIHTDILWRLK